MQRQGLDKVGPRPFAKVPARCTHFILLRTPDGKALRRMNLYRLTQAIIAMVLLLGLLYLGDWALFRIRVSHGTGYGSVEVHQFLATSLKGSKTEYDMTGTVQQACSHSLFPQGGDRPCWWLETHRSQWE